MIISPHKSPFRGPKGQSRSRLPALLALVGLVGFIGLFSLSLHYTHIESKHEVGQKTAVLQKKLRGRVRPSGDRLEVKRREQKSDLLVNNKAIQDTVSKTKSIMPIPHTVEDQNVTQKAEEGCK